MYVIQLYCVQLYCIVDVPNNLPLPSYTHQSIPSLQPCWCSRLLDSYSSIVLLSVTSEPAPPTPTGAGVAFVQLQPRSSVSPSSAPASPGRAGRLLMPCSVAPPHAVRTRPRRARRSPHPPPRLIEQPPRPLLMKRMRLRPLRSTTIRTTVRKITTKGKFDKTD